MLVRDAARRVDDEGLRQSPHPVVDRDTAARVAPVRIADAELVEEGTRFRLLVLGVDTKEDHVLVLEFSPHRLEHRCLRPAWWTPRRPEIEEHHLAAEVLDTDPAAAEEHERKAGRRAPEKRRGDVLRLTTEPVREESQNGERRCQHRDSNDRPPSPDVVLMVPDLPSVAIRRAGAPPGCASRARRGSVPRSFRLDL